MTKISYRSFAPPLFSLALIMLGQGFFNTFVSLKIASEGYSYSINGLVNSFYYIGMMLGGIYIERFMKNIGHIRAFAIFASLNGAIICIQCLTFNIGSWMFLRFCTGICGAGLFIVIESWLLLVSNAKTRGRILAIYMVALYAAQAAGQFLINFTSIDSPSAFLATIFLSSISVAPICMMKSEIPQIVKEPSVTNILYICKNSFFGVFGCFLSGMALSAFYSLAPVFAKSSGFSILEVSQIMGFTIFGGLALQWPLGKLSDCINRLKVLLFVAITLFIISLLLFLEFKMPFPFFLLLCILFGGFSFTLYPLSITYACDSFPHSKIVAVTCSMLIVYGMGAILGPLIAPLPMQLISPSALFLYMSILSFLLIVFGIIEIRKPVKPKEEESQEKYVPLPGTTPLAYHLDPRQEKPSSDQENKKP